MGKKSKKGRTKTHTSALVKKKYRVPVDKPLDIPFYVSGYMHELITRLHKEYPAKEWSGIARIQKIDGVHVMVDVIFPEQENSATNTEMTEDGLHSMVELILERDPTGQSLPEWNCWLHSHHSMQVFWSGTDDTARQGFNDGVTKHRWHVVTAYSGPGGSTIYKCALDIYKPTPIAFDVPVLVQEFDQEAFNRDNVKLYDDMVEQLELVDKQRAVDLEKAEEALAAAEKQRELDIQAVTIQFEDPSIDHILDIIGEDKKELVEEMIDEEKVILQEETVEDVNKRYDKARKEVIDDINKRYDSVKDDVMKSFGGDIFDKKLKELADNIVVPRYTSTTLGFTGYNKGKKATVYAPGRSGPNSIHYGRDPEDYWKKELDAIEEMETMEGEEVVDPIIEIFGEEENNDDQYNSLVAND